MNRTLPGRRTKVIRARHIAVETQALVCVNTLNFFVPGDPCTRTGGYIYGARIVCGLRARGWTVNVRQLHDSFPAPDASALAHAGQQLDALGNQALVLVDGLAFGAMPALAQQHCERLRLIALLHHPLADETGLDPQMARALASSEKSALAAAHHVIVTSARTAADLKEHYAVADGKLSVVEPGTEPVAQIGPSPQSPTAATTKATRDDPPLTRLLCVATVTPRKGHDLLIKALAPLAGQRWQLRCAGSVRRSPHTTRRLREIIRQCGLNRQVQLLGEISDSALHDCYDWADVFVLATRLEGYGMALAEAVAHGLPVITSVGGAAADTVGSEAALLIPRDDVGALSDALRRLIHEPGLRAELAAAARRRARQLPNWNDATAAIERILRHVSRR